VSFADVDGGDDCEGGEDEGSGDGLGFHSSDRKLADFFMEFVAGHYAGDANPVFDDGEIKAVFLVDDGCVCELLVCQTASVFWYADNSVPEVASALLVVAAGGIVSVAAHVAGVAVGFGSADSVHWAFDASGVVRFFGSAL
jgi:hypothetical protein